ncbi:hypothetical protein [Achromobacter xylosoxidans]|uniref:hypothetical protein n=1 Tax=Alcaligenes xylosoxydans xylosoxydans TaxID=85698 RepID=UPI001231CF80|nr:hypothetical protein [Achromobacter xylosoxidans]KAA5923043.1 hypothetical protein F1536_17175 [Achromobacter xylosoxidans]MBK1982202.1 hypothetical protein [Achromobacter xylosoxidans]
MSEPYSAFLKLQIPRGHLAQWLAAPVPAASRWSDWGAIGGQWYLRAGKDLAASSDQDLGRLVAECDAMLARHPDNRAALKAILNSAQAENIKIAAYDRAGTHFVAGSLTYSENLYDLIVFFTVARGAADFFAADGHGLAVVHDYLWGEEGERETVAALGLSGQGGSRFAAPDEQGDAAGAFERMVETMLDGKDDPEFHPRDQLDGF